LTSAWPVAASGIDVLTVEDVVDLSSGDFLFA
jgi:hypothetical protein